MPDMYAGQLNNFVTSVQQTQTEVLFFTAIAPWRELVSSHRLYGGQPKYMSTANKERHRTRFFAPHGITAIGRKDVKSNGGNLRIFLQQIDCNPNFVTLQEPGIVIKADEVIFTGRVHPMIPCCHIALIGRSTGPVHLRKVAGEF